MARWWDYQMSMINSWFINIAIIIIIIIYKKMNDCSFENLQRLWLKIICVCVCVWVSVNDEWCHRQHQKNTENKTNKMKRNGITYLHQITIENKMKRRKYKMNELVVISHTHQTQIKDVPNDHDHHHLIIRIILIFLTIDYWTQFYKFWFFLKYNKKK